LEQLEQIFDCGTIFRRWSSFSALEQFFGFGAVFRIWSSFSPLEQVEQFPENDTVKIFLTIYSSKMLILVLLIERAILTTKHTKKIAKGTKTLAAQERCNHFQLRTKTKTNSLPSGFTRRNPMLPRNRL
jgi:hypothetical protein